MGTEQSTFITAIITHLRSARAEHDEIISGAPILNPDDNNSTLRFPCEDKELIKQACKLARIVATDLLTECQDSITFDMKGHCRVKETLTLKDMSDKYTYSPMSIKYIAQRLGFAFAQLIFNLPLNPEDDFDWELHLKSAHCFIDPSNGKIQITGDEHVCNQCGKTITLYLDTETMTIAPDYYFSEDGLSAVLPCEYPEGVTTWHADIAVSSGKLVMANALTRIMPEEMVDLADDYICETAGQFLTIGMARIAHVYKTDYFAKLNVMYMQAGNCGPYIFKNKQTGDIVVKNDFRIENGEEFENFSEEEEIVGEICMDLWASTAMCMDTFINFCKLSDIDPEQALKDNDATVIDVQNGTYRATNLYFEDDHRCDKFVSIKRIAS